MGYTYVRVHMSLEKHSLLNLLLWLHHVSRYIKHISYRAIAENVGKLVKYSNK